MNLKKMITELSALMSVTGYEDRESEKIKEIADNIRISGFYLDRIPTFGGACIECRVDKLAVMKCALADDLHVAWNEDACELHVAAKYVILDLGYCVGNG